MIDFLVWTFGKYKNLKLSFNHEKHIVGTLQFENTNVYFIFSTMHDATPFRHIEFDGHRVDLITHFSLHNLAYQDILDGHPLSISDIEPTIKLCEEIRNYK